MPRRAGSRVASGGLTGFRRPGGEVGIRNHVVALPIDDVSNSVCRMVSKRVPGVVPLDHAYGEMQYGEDAAVTFRTLIGTGRNPNVAAVVAIGSEQEDVLRVADAISGTGKPVEALWTWNVGDLRTCGRAVRTAAQLVRDASDIRRQPIDRSELVLSMKCGESDTTSAVAAGPVTGSVSDAHIADGGTVVFGETSELSGAHDLIAERCATDAVRRRFVSVYQRYTREIEESGADLFGTQPTLANIRGGVSTLEEKALGSVAKTGSAPVVGVLDPAQAPTRAGLSFMDTSASAPECGTLMAAAGAVLHLFPCGGGNVVGHPIQPVLKLSANPVTVERMGLHTDVDLSRVLTGEWAFDEAGRELRRAIDATINGRLTWSEVLGHRELAITRLHRSA